MSIPSALQATRSNEAQNSLPLLPEAERHGAGHGLMQGRVHELCGPARHRMALWLAAQTRGEILWVVPEWSADALNPCGIMPYVDPARLILVQPKRAEDVLWCMEEALRSGTLALAVGDLPGLPGLTPVRRMHLAAEAGSAKGGPRPTGLLLTPGMGGAQGVESRWHLAPDHCARPGGWQLSRLRARMAPERRWHVAQRPGQPLPRIAHPITAA